MGPWPGRRVLDARYGGEGWDRLEDFSRALKSQGPRLDTAHCAWLFLL